VLPFFSLGRAGGAPFQVVFGVESGQSPVHFPLDQWTVDFPSKPFFSLVLGQGFKAKSSQCSIGGAPLAGS
jgi:hypothetical protein